MFFNFIFIIIFSDTETNPVLIELLIYSSFIGYPGANVDIVYLVDVSNYFTVEF